MGGLRRFGRIRTGRIRCGRIFAGRIGSGRDGVAVLSGLTCDLRQNGDVFAFERGFGAGHDLAIRSDLVARRV